MQSLVDMIGSAGLSIAWALASGVPLVDSKPTVFPGILQPARYLSSSGEYALEIDPSDPEGVGPASYALTRGGTVVWSAELPYALWKAAVSDRGVVAGYTDPQAELFRVVLLDPAGATLRCDGYQRERDRNWRGTSSPWMRGVFVQDELDLTVFRAWECDEQRTGEVWWTFALASGEKCSELRGLPGSEYAQLSVDAIALPGSPLTLVQWQRGPVVSIETYGGRRHSAGARFNLLDECWQEVWRLEPPWDHVPPGEKEYDGPPPHHAHAAILGAPAPDRFELRLSAGRERAAYEVARSDASGWIVRETERAPYAPPRGTWPDLTSIDLELLGSVVLGQPGVAIPGPIRDIEEFAVLPDGSIEFVRREIRPGSFSIVRMGPRGEFVRERTIDRGDKPGASFAWSRLANGRWLMLSGLQASTIDIESGNSSRLKGFSGGGVRRIAPVADGGFVVLTRNSVLRYDDRGSLLWKHFDWPKRDLTVTNDGRIVVLENQGASLEILDLDGKLVEMRTLPAAIDRDRLTGVSADRDGGLFVHELGSPPVIWRIDRNGGFVGKLEFLDPEGLVEDGSELRARMCSDEKLWATDGHILVELDSSGVVRRTLGNRALATEILWPTAAFVHGNGEIFVQDDRTADVHVFGPDGGRLRVARARSDERETARSIARIAVAADGSILAELRYEDWYYLLGPDGSSLGIRNLCAEQVAFPPAGDRYWGAGEHEIRCHAADATIVRTIERRPDHRFFDQIEDLAFAPDGRLTVLDASGLAIFDSEGAPLGTFALPEGHPQWRLAFGGRWVAIGDYDADVLLIDTTGPTCFRFVPNQKTIPVADWRFGFSPDGTELWALEKEALVLHRFALP